MDIRIKILRVTCSILQIVGFVLITLHFVTTLPPFISILIGISGFAALVKAFLPERTVLLDDIAAVAGVGIIVIWCAMA